MNIDRNKDMGLIMCLIDGRSPAAFMAVAMSRGRMQVCCDVLFLFIVCVACTDHIQEIS
jgi:hypothetical protein